MHGYPFVIDPGQCVLNKRQVQPQFTVGGRRSRFGLLPATMLHAFNSRGVAVKALAVELGIDAHPMAIITLRNRTLSPAVELFIDTVRAVGKSMAEASK